MATKEERARKRAEKSEAKAREAIRLAQADKKMLAEIARNADTQRKILEGVAAIYGCEHSEEFARMHAMFRDKALTLNKDREVFGLPPLPVETTRRGRRRTDTTDADANGAGSSPASADSSADAPAESKAA